MRLWSALVVAGCWTGTATPTAPPPEQHTYTIQARVAEASVVFGTIEGTVTDLRTNQAAPGVEVELTSSHEAKRTTATRLNGHYRFDHLAPGDYELEWSTATRPQPGPLAPVLVGSSKHALVHVIEGSSTVVDVMIDLPPPLP